jgi:hypothetical protein
MTPMIATSVALQLGRLACAYVHSSPKPSQLPGLKNWGSIRRVTDFHFVGVHRHKMDTRRFAYFPCTRLG